MSKENLPLKLTLSFDNHLMYLIQDVTKKDSLEILGFFGDLTKAIANIGYEKRTGDGIKKQITDFFPGTSIPFHILLKGKATHYREFDYTKRAYVGEAERVFLCTAEVGFPDVKSNLPQSALDKISEALMERELLGYSEIKLEPFDRPQTPTSKLYKKLMEEVCGKKQIRVNTDHYDPDITGKCRNCGWIPGHGWRKCTCGKAKETP